MEVLNLNNIYYFFNNATIAGLFVLIGGLFLGQYVYREQKDIDREMDIKSSIIDNVLELKALVSSVNLIMVKLANTYKSYQGSEEDFLNEQILSEIEKISELINDKIPYLDEILVGHIELYFGQGSTLFNEYELFQYKLKEWHDPIVSFQINLRDKRSLQDMISTKEIDERIPKIIGLIKKEKLNL